MTATNRRELRVIGMSRSGNHAIINWIRSQTGGRVCFINCAEPKSNPFHTARPIYEDGTNPIEATFDDFDAEREGRGVFSPKDWLIVSHEDCFLGMITRGAYEEHHDAFVGPSAERCDVLILRDPFNLFASRWKSGYRFAVTPLTEIRIWKQHAREFLGERRYLGENRVLVSYNAWVSDREYRRRLAGRLGLDFSDAGFDTVATTGGGSSFDSVRYDGRASRMRVFERWRHFAGNARFRRIFDPEMVRLSERIFGPIRGTRRLLGRPKSPCSI